MSGELGSRDANATVRSRSGAAAGAAATPGVYDGERASVLRARSRARSRVGSISRRLTVSGEPTTVVETVDYDPPGQAAFTHRQRRAHLSRETTSPAGGARVGRSRRRGVGHRSPRRRARFARWRCRPMDSTIAIDRRDAQGLPSVWLVDTARGASSRLTAAYWSGDPLWSPDGRTLAYSIAADSPPNLVVRGDGGKGAERRLTQQATEQHYATSFTPDGRQIVFQALTATTGSDLYVVSAIDERPTPQRLLQTAPTKRSAACRPMAAGWPTCPMNPGQPEVYLAPFPEAAGAGHGLGGRRHPAVLACRRQGALLSRADRRRHGGRRSPSARVVSHRQADRALQGVALRRRLRAGPRRQALPDRPAGADRRDRSARDRPQSAPLSTPRPVGTPRAPIFPTR